MLIIRLVVDISITQQRKIDRKERRMYPVIKETLEKKHMSLVDLANATGIRYQTLSQKLLGNYKITVDEALAIKSALGVRTPIEVLFTQELKDEKGTAV